MKEIYNVFYCRICNNINKIQSNFTKSKKLICNNCENVFYYELFFCKKCNKSTYCTKLESDTNSSKYICICNEIYTIENREIYKNSCCYIS
jgi:hypothetical protein